eukprot:3934636-Rhodomonas_salina.1
MTEYIPDSDPSDTEPAGTDCSSIPLRKADSGPRTYQAASSSTGSIPVPTQGNDRATREEHRQLYSRLAEMGMRWVEVLADGDCFYHCLSRLPGTRFRGRAPAEIRRELAQSIQWFWEGMTEEERLHLQLSIAPQSFAQYIAGVRNSQWADEFVIAMASRTLDLTLRFWRPGPDDPPPTTVRFEGAREDVVVHILFVNARGAGLLNHFRPVIAMDETDSEDDFTTRSNPWFVPRPGPTDVDQRHYGHSPRNVVAGSDSYSWTCRWHVSQRRVVEELSARYPDTAAVVVTDGHKLPLSLMVDIQHATREQQDWRQSRYELGFAAFAYDIWLSDQLIWHVFHYMSADRGWGCGQGRMGVGKAIWILDPQAYTYWASTRSTWMLPEGAIQARRWLIPVNIPNSHWFLMVLDIESGRLHVEDAMGVDRPTERSEVTAWIQSMAPHRSRIDREWSHTFSKRKRQHSGTDCGIFLLADAMCIADGLDASAIQEDIPTLRDWLAYMLWSKGTLSLPDRHACQENPAPMPAPVFGASARDAPPPEELPITLASTPPPVSDETPIDLTDSPPTAGIKRSSLHIAEAAAIPAGTVNEDMPVVTAIPIQLDRLRRLNSPRIQRGPNVRQRQTTGLGSWMSAPVRRAPPLPQQQPLRNPTTAARRALHAQRTA